MAAIPLLDPEKNTAYHCVCEHYFNEPDLLKMVDISWCGPKSDFDINEHTYVLQVCPECGTCCSMEDEDGRGNGDLHERDCGYSCGDEQAEQWLCLGCAKVYDSESDALDCCP